MRKEMLIKEVENKKLCGVRYGLHQVEYFSSNTLAYVLNTFSKYEIEEDEDKYIMKMKYNGEYHIFKK